MTSTFFATALVGDLRRGLEHVGEIDAEAHVGEGGGDDLGAAIVAVLAHLCDQNARFRPALALKASILARIALYSASS